MTEKVFQILQGGEKFGKHLYAASGSSIEPGLLVKYASGSTVTLNTAAGVPVGYAFGLRYSPYKPTTKVFTAAEDLTIVFGVGIALASVDFFAEDSLPAANATLYAGDHGRMTTTAGSNKKVGVVKETVTRKEAIGGVGSGQDLCLFYFDISPFGT